MEGPGGDDPRDPNLFRREAYPLDEDRPTRAETDSDEHELRSWPRAQYGDGGA